MYTNIENNLRKKNKKYEEIVKEGEGGGSMTGSSFTLNARKYWWIYSRRNISVVPSVCISVGLSVRICQSVYLEGFDDFQEHLEILGKNIFNRIPTGFSCKVENIFARARVFLASLYAYRVFK